MMQKQAGMFPESGVRASNMIQNKKDLITTKKHLIIESAHPSPFSARNGFFGSKPFSKTNDFLISNNIKPIDWEIK